MNKQLNVKISTEVISESFDDEDCKFWRRSSDISAEEQVLKTGDKTIRRYKYWRLKITSEEQLLMYYSSVVAVQARSFVPVRRYKFWRTTADDLFISSCTVYQKFISHQKFTAQSSSNQTRTSVVTFYITSCISLCICLCFRFTFTHAARSDHCINRSAMFRLNLHFSCPSIYELLSF